jgi:hypothetical protein
MAAEGDGNEQAHEQRVRERAYKIWLERNCPEGRADDHWREASELVAIEESYLDTLRPNPIETYENSPTTEPVEPIEAVRNLGEFPTLSDQGEEAVFPDRNLMSEAAEPPVTPGRQRAPRASLQRKSK